MKKLMHTIKVRDTYLVLLCALFFALLTAPLVTLVELTFPFLRGSAALNPQLIIITTATAWTAWRNVHFDFVPTLIGAIVVSILAILSAIFHENFGLTHIFAQIVFFGFAIFALVKAVLTSKKVNGNTLAGAVCVYMLLGVIGGMLFSSIEILQPGSFYIEPVVAPADVHRAEINPGFMMYFSFVTLTTVGFGDMLPVSEAARSACVLVAVLGQLTLVILISRLVGLHIADKSSAK